MSHKMAALVLGACLFAGAAQAGTIENAYANTIIVTQPDGVVMRYHFNEDARFTVTAPDGTEVSGDYWVRGAELCLLPDDGDVACVPYEADKNVGDTWTQVGSDGQQITVLLEEGR
jgi:hypothetical protein